MMYLTLFYEYLKVGLFSIGGGLATIPFLTDLSQRTGWFTLDELADMVAVAESTPGPIGVNVATYVGYKLLGIPGAVVSTLGLVCPCFLIILFVSKILEKFQSNMYVQSAMRGLRPTSMALITSSLWFLVVSSFGFFSSIKVSAIILAIVLYIATNYVKKLKNVHPIIFIIFAAIVGVICKVTIQ